MIMYYEEETEVEEEKKKPAILLNVRPPSNSATAVKTLTFS